MVLFPSSWDDYFFKTSFEAKYIDRDGVNIDLGTIKIEKKKREIYMIVDSDKQNFLICAYLKIDPSDLLNLDDSDAVKRIIKRCINKAYQDLKRRVPYAYSTSELDDMSNSENKKTFILLKQQFYDDVEGIIYGNIIDADELVKEEINPRVIIQKVNAIKNDDKYGCLFTHGETFTVGLSQKWVNMTLKYLWSLGIISDKYEELLEIPIDDYMLRKIEKEYKLVKKIKWSNWDNMDEYDALQDTLKNILLKEDITRIRWENRKWIEASLENVN